MTRAVYYQILNIFLLLVTTTCSICDATLPSNFVFGDSLVDVGNNNYIVSLSKANFEPNGIDFGTPTGRYTNGRTIVDIIGQELGFIGFSPPFLAPKTTGPIVMKGVNYASGGGGILNHTGKIFVGRINFDAQMDNFESTRQYIFNTLGESSAMALLNSALFSVTLGSNDFINNYLTPVVSKVEQKLVPPEVFVAAMISRYELQLTRLYNMGGRKIVVVNVGPIGCIPFLRELDPYAGNACSPFPNQLAQMFNDQLRVLISELSANLDGSEFVYADVYRIVDDLIQNYTSYGIENPNSACCHVAGRFGGLIPCSPASKICEDRSKYVFWDPYHPTEAANLFIAKRLLDGDSMDIWPKNLRHLISSPSS